MRITINAGRNILNPWEIFRETLFVLLNAKRVSQEPYVL